MRQQGRLLYAVSSGRKGQDDAARFLRTGSVQDDAIALCPVGAKVSGNVCERAAADGSTDNLTCAVMYA